MFLYCDASKSRGRARIAVVDDFYNVLYFREYKHAWSLSIDYLEQLAIRAAVQLSKAGDVICSDSLTAIGKMKGTSIIWVPSEQNKADAVATFDNWRGISKAFSFVKKVWKK